VRLHVAAVESLTAERAEHCTIGREEERIRSQTEVFKQGRSVGCAAAGSDGDTDAGALGSGQGTAIARGDGAAS
jgi:hypothetical protein